MPSALQLNHFPAPRAAPGEAGRRVLVLMLPGAQMRPEAFAENGLVDTLHDRAADTIALGIGLDAYLAGQVAERLHEEVVAPALRQGCAELWLVGVSLGGMGALAFARAYPEVTSGVILLAPFLGTRGTVAEVARAGSLAAWQPDATTREHPDGALLAWLKAGGDEPITRPAVHLGYGREDRFGAASRLLETRLPASRVVSVEGGHDWPTWRRLWPLLLAATPLGAAPAHA